MRKARSMALLAQHAWAVCGLYSGAYVWIMRCMGCHEAGGVAMQLHEGQNPCHAAVGSSAGATRTDSWRAGGGGGGGRGFGDPLEGGGRGFGMGRGRGLRAGGSFSTLKVRIRSPAAQRSAEQRSLCPDRKP